MAQLCPALGHRDRICYCQLSMASLGGPTPAGSEEYRFETTIPGVLGLRAPEMC